MEAVTKRKKTEKYQTIEKKIIKERENIKPETIFTLVSVSYFPLASTPGIVSLHMALFWYREF